MKHWLLVIFVFFFSVSEGNALAERASAHYSPTEFCNATPTPTPILLPSLPCTPTPTLVNVSIPVEQVTGTPAFTSTPTPTTDLLPTPTELVATPTSTAGASANLTNSSVVVQSIPDSAPSTGRAE